ncbi:MAG: TetR/AcrR family transcriptional regulator [Myxococcota bacterium]
MGRPRADADLPATPERILGAAAEAFAAHGLADAKLADIARRAGISRPSLLYHFATKELLYATVVRRVFEQLTVELARPIQLQVPFVVKAEALVRTYAAFLGAHPAHARIVVREFLVDDSPGSPILRAAAAPVLDLVEAFLCTAGAAHVRPGLPVRAAVMQIASDLLLQNAAAAVGPLLWGPPSVDRSWTLARTLVLTEEG